MISALDSGSQAFLASLNAIGQRMQTAQKQIATGLRVSSVSDDPDQVSAILQTRANLESSKTSLANLGRVKAEVDGGEQALGAAVSIMERVRTLATQGDSGTATAESRTVLANEMGSMLEQLGSISRTTIEGRYIFSGDTDQVAPYTIDLLQTNPISVYAGSASTRQVQNPNGTRFLDSLNAQEVFDSPNQGQNVFYAVNNMRTALLNNDQAAIDSALPDVISSLTYLNGKLAFYGTVQNKVADATGFGQTLQTQLTVQLSTLQDADITQAITDFQQASIQQQAALALRGKLPRTTLFDYLG